MSKTNGALIPAADLIVARLEPACRMLAEARDAVDAKQVADLARAAEVYARRQKLSEEAIAYATAVKVDAMTLMGEFLKAAPKASAGRPTKISTNEELISPPTQEEVLGKGGRKIASDAQALAAMKADAPDLHQGVKEGKLSIPEARREVRRREKLDEMEARAAQAPPAPHDDFRIIAGDCLEELAKLDAGSAGLCFADPPYNVGIDYGDGEAADRLPDDAYLAWCRSWFDQVRRVLAGDGAFWLLCGYEYADLLAVELRRAGFHRRSWLTWYETFGVCNSSRSNFSRTSRPLFYCVKDPRRFCWNADAVSRPSDRQTKYDDARADPAGKVWDDVWQIPRVAGTFGERVPGFPTQLPLALLLPVIGATSDPGDLVLDPFNGSGTTGEAAIRLGRRYLGIEKQPEFARLALQRLKGVPCGEEKV